MLILNSLAESFCSYIINNQTDEWTKLDKSTLKRAEKYCKDQNKCLELFVKKKLKYINYYAKCEK